MKKIKFAILAFLFCCCLGFAVTAEEPDLYVTEIEAVFDIPDTPFAINLGINADDHTVMHDKLINFGFKSVTFEVTENAGTEIIKAYHTEPVDKNALEEYLLREPQFDVRDADGKILIDESHLKRANLYQAQGNSGKILSLDLTEEGQALLGEATERIVAEKEGKHYISIYVNEQFVFIKEFTERMNVKSIEYNMSDSKYATEILNSIWAGGKSLLPEGGTEIVSINKKTGIKCSPWAVDYVCFMLGHNLESIGANKDFTKAITREKFCEYAAGIIFRYAPPITETDFRYIDDYVSTFKDTDSCHVAVLHELGIINGRSEKIFAPDDEITREEAAAILCRMLKYMTKNADLSYRKPYTFADDSDISDWAKENVYTVFSYRIMNGVGADNFDAKGTYTVEQAFATFQRTAYTANDIRRGNFHE